MVRPGLYADEETRGACDTRLGRGRLDGTGAGQRARGRFAADAALAFRCDRTVAGRCQPDRNPGLQYDGQYLPLFADGLPRRYEGRNTRPGADRDRRIIRRRVVPGVLRRAPQFCGARLIWMKPRRGFSGVFSGGRLRYGFVADSLRTYSAKPVGAIAYRASGCRAAVIRGRARQRIGIPLFPGGLPE